MYLQTPIEMPSNGSFMFLSVRAAEGQLTVEKLYRDIRGQWFPAVYKPTAQLRIKREQIDLIGECNTAIIVPGHHVLRWIAEQGGQFCALPDFVSAEEFFLRLVTDMEEMSGNYAACILHTPGLMNLIAPEKRREFERLLVLRCMPYDTRWVKTLSDYGWGVDEICALAEEVLPDPARSQIWTELDCSALGVFGLERALPFVEQAVKQWPTLFLAHEQGMFRYQLEILFDYDEEKVEEVNHVMNRLISLACRSLKKVPDPKLGSMIDGFYEVMDTVSRQTLEDRFAAAMGVELDCGGVYLVGHTLHALVMDPEWSDNRQPLLNRLLEAMNADNAGIIFRWLAAVTQPQDRSVDNPLPDAWFYSAFREKLFECGWEFAEVQIDIDQHGQVKTNRVSDIQLVAITSSRSYNDKRVKWIHSGNGMDVRPGMVVVIPTRPLQGHECVFSVSSICGYRIDLSEYTLVQRVYGLGRKIRKDGGVQVLSTFTCMKPYMGRTSRYRVQYIMDEGLPMIVWNLYDGDRPGYDHQDYPENFFQFRSSMFNWLGQLFLKVKAERLGLGEKWWETPGVEEKLKLLIEDLLELNGATVELREKERNLCTLSVRGGALAGRRYEVAGQY